jgi:hypothetical protein
MSYFSVVRTTLVYASVLRNSVTSSDAKNLNAFSGLLQPSARTYGCSCAHFFQILFVRTFNETKQEIDVVFVVICFRVSSPVHIP